MSEKPAVTKGLRKVLGFTSLFIITIGLVVSQTSVVSILQGAGLGGGTFFIAIFIAFILTLCYISTYAELALMMPKAGSISTYTAVSSDISQQLLLHFQRMLPPQYLQRLQKCY
ncbi:MAG: hypothetical protein IPG90_18640 [Bacteroidetes bacterium]|nr:hypothetical protein [Bacteroidota bacterium]